MSILSWKTVTVDTTATGKTLATLLGGALSQSVSMLTLLPAAAGISVAYGEAAVAGTNDLPVGGLAFRANKTEADLLKFIGTGSIKMTVIQES